VDVASIACGEGTVLGGLWVQGRWGCEAQRLAGLGEAIENLRRAAGAGVTCLELEGRDAGSEIGASDEGADKKRQLVVLFAKELSGPAQVGVDFPGEVAGGIVVEEDGLCDGV
jgi:hypothetical protein